MPKIVLHGVGVCVGLIGLGVLVTLRILDDVVKRNSWA